MAVVTQLMQDNVTELYIGFFGRAPDAAGFGYWTNRLAQGDVTIQQISKAFSATPEFVSNYNGLTPTQQVTKVYANVLGRAPDAGGLAYWVGQITSGTQTIADVVWNVTNSAFIQGTGTADGALVANKVTVGEYFAITMASNNTTAAASAFNGVTSAPSSVITAEAALQQAVATVYTLTTATESVTGSGMNVVGSGTIESTNGTFTSATTYNSTDSIVLTGSNNYITVTVDGAFKTNTNTALNAPAVSGVQTLSVRNVATGTGAALTVDASNYAGLTTFVNNLSTNVTTVTSLASGAAAQITGNGVTSNAAFNAGYATAATAATLNLVSGTTGGAVTLSGTGLTSTVVNSIGAANTIGALALAATTTGLTINAATNLTTGAVTNTTAAALTSLTITGAGAVNLSSTGLESTVATVNAAANTGGVTLTLGTGVTSFVGGTAADVVTSAATTATGAVINGGTGSADTLILAATNDVSTAAKGASYINFENLVLNNSQNVSYIAGISAVQLNAMTSKSVTGLSAAQAQALTLAGSQTTALTLGLTDSSGTADAVSVTMNAGYDIAGLTIAGVETLNLTAAAGSTGSSSDTTLAANGNGALTTVNLSGAYGIGFSGTNSANVLTVNGASLTGIATIAGNFVNASTITTGSANDSITLGTGFATYNSGLGNDTFNAATVGELNTNTSYNTLNGGGGTDTLNITGAQAITMVDTNFKQMSGIEAIVQASTTTNDLSVTTGAWFNQNFAAGVSYTATTGIANSALDMSTATVNTTISLTTAAATTKTVAVSTGTGIDSVTIAATDFVGAAGKLITVATGAGADTISVSPAAATALAVANAITITGGAGADVITLGTHVNGSSAGTAGYVQIAMGATDSTVAAADTVTGFKLGAAGTQSDNLDFTGSATVAADATSQGVTGYTAAQLTYSIATGILTFSGTSAATLTAAQAIAAVESLALANTATVLFVNNGNSYVFNNNTAGDALVQLVGITAADALVTTNNNGANDLFIS